MADVETKPYDSQDESLSAGRTAAPTIEIPDSQPPDTPADVDPTIVDQAQKDLDLFMQGWPSDQPDELMEALQEINQQGDDLEVMSKSESLPAPWGELTKSHEAPLCKKCQLPTDLARMVVKRKGGPAVGTICRACNNATTMLSRNLNSWPLPSFPALSSEAQVNFWRKCGDIITQNGRLEYKHLRANLTMVLCEKEIEETTMRFTSEFLPLDVWKQRGFDTEAVKRGKKDVHPLLGEVYAVPLKTVSKGYIKQRVEEMLCKFEADARKKAGCSKGQKALKDGEVSADNTNGAEAVEDDSMKALEWMSGSPQKRAASEMEPEQSEVPAPEEESNEDAKRRKKNNQQIQKLAKKALAKVSTCKDALKAQMANKENLPPKSVEELQDALGEVEKMEDECQVGSKVLGPTKALSSLSFGDKELSMYVKDWKNVASRAQRMVKLISKAK